MIYRCKNCKSEHNFKSLVYKCEMCSKHICENCSWTEFSNVVVNDGIKVCKECYERRNLK